MPWALSGGKTVGRHTPAAQPEGGTGPVAHGSELTVSHVGPWTLQGVAKGSETLDTVSVPGRGYWRLDTPDEFAPTGTYTYNNDPANKGGVVPTGGLTIDGYAIPAGARVVQFRDFSTPGAADFASTGSGVFVFRGCRYRCPSRAPAMFNSSAFTGQLFFGYGDLGGLSAANADYNEVPIKMSGGSGALYRNYVTYTTTGLQVNSNGYDVIENYITKLTYYYGPNPPPGEDTDKHLNGITYNGGETCARILRNYITLPTPDDGGRAIVQTDAISFFQDFGTFPGTGTNRDATTGYQVHDNYVGGGQYCIYAGRNAGAGETTVQNMVITGTKITTQWYANGGNTGALAAIPVWGSYGNTWSGNTWADGPNAGQTIPNTG